MNEYRELLRKYRDRLQDIRIWKRDSEELKAYMEENNLTEADFRPAFGGVVEKIGSSVYNRIYEKALSDIDTHIARDPDGSGFIKDMFEAEIKDLLFGKAEELCLPPVTYEYYLSDIMTCPKLKNGFFLALEEIKEMRTDYDLYS